VLDSFNTSTSYLDMFECASNVNVLSELLIPRERGKGKEAFNSEKSIKWNECSIHQWMMHPLLFLLYSVDLGATTAPEMPISISDANAKHVKGVQDFVEAIKSITSNISTSSRKQLIFNVILDIPGMVNSPADDQKVKAIKSLELQVDEVCVPRSISGVQNQLGIKQFTQVGIKHDGNLWEVLESNLWDLLKLPHMVRPCGDGYIQKAVQQGSADSQAHSCPKAMGIAITTSLLVTKDICAGKQFEDVFEVSSEVSIQAGASFRLLLQAMLGAFEGDDTFLHIFLETHSKNRKNLPRDLKMILVILSNPLINPMITSMEADPFHKYSTMDDARTRILTAANTLTFVETLRSNFKNETNALEKSALLFEDVDEIKKQLDKLVDDYIKTVSYLSVGVLINCAQDYNEKVRKMISAVMNDADIEGDKEKAAALMKVLTEVHTNDRFVVAVYSDDCDMKRFATVHLIFNVILDIPGMVNSPADDQKVKAIKSLELQVDEVCVPRSISGVQNQLGIKQFTQVGIKHDGNLWEVLESNLWDLLKLPHMVRPCGDGYIQKAVQQGSADSQAHSCPKAMGIAITTSLLVTKDICAGKQFEDVFEVSSEVSIQAGASFRLLLQAMLGAFEGDDTFLHIFLETHSKNRKNLPRDLKMILVILSNPLINPMITSMEADPFHKYSTMDDARTRILTAANTLTFVETLRSNFKNETNALEKSALLFEDVDEIKKQLDKLVDDYIKTDYNEKVRKMISAVMNDADIEGDKEKAAALMKVLTEVHTNDRFVVAVYSDDCDMKRFATVHHANQLINDPLRKVLVYRSTQAYSMTGKEPVEFTEAAKDTEEITSANVRRTARNVPMKLKGLVLIREIKYVCTMAIEQDPRFILPNYDNVTRCIDHTLSVRSLCDVNVIRYPE
ncbi:hypothetical protein PRIPAC_82750, partial [Pristionchus pacificus]|uniref:Uncharacterized protein n=1 Tax=Pristionchus pacificus TaxID=54126 RepID=A0A2A6BX16_PRIPA